MIKNEKLFVVTQEENKPYEKQLLSLIQEYEEMIEEKGETKKVKRKTNYFKESDVWTIEDVCSIERFKQENKKYELQNRNINFNDCSLYFKLEFKAIFFNKLMNEEWTLKTIFSERNYHLDRLTCFLKERYPKITSLKELDIDEADLKWINWLKDQGVNIVRKYKKKNNDMVYETRSSLGSFMKYVVESIDKITDTREEWKKDRWDVRNLSQYGLYFNESVSNYCISFEQFKDEKFKEIAKKYCKERLIKNNDFTWGTARRTADILTDYFNFMKVSKYSLETFKRSDFVAYLQHVRKKTVSNDKPDELFNRSIAVVRKFLKDIQLFDWKEAPKTDIQLIIFTSDKMKSKRKSKTDVKYIPDYVLDQLVSHLDTLPKTVQMVISLMLHSGLRVSDVLRLNRDCLVKINGKYWIETDIEKTNIENHKVPIDEKIASALAVMIDQSKEESTSGNNPKGYIFCNLTGRRKGFPYEQRSISTHLNHLAKEKQITDEMGKVWNFKNHSFRHTYAVKLINNGVSLTVVQDLLAHASPEMTLTYARLVDDTKRKEWEKAYDSGAFRFDDSGKSMDVNLEEMASDEGLKWEWVRHNLDAVKVSHGFCFVNAKQGCKYQVNPCLNANGGKPCKHLAVTPEFAPMYEFDIEMKRKVIEEGKLRGDDYRHWVDKNQKELGRIEEIYNIIKNGETFFQKKDTICGKGDEGCPLTNKDSGN